ncbi:MAG TPA: hypothetical protein VFF25_02810 [Clostridia bacterium]|nr:hypothetical protein [Clostridia bacterium]
MNKEMQYFKIIKLKNITIKKGANKHETTKWIRLGIQSKRQSS